MKPYYRDSAAGIEIYHGDCREVLPTLDCEVDMLLTDPPYPGLKGRMVHPGLGGVARSTGESKTVGVPWGESLDWIPAAWKSVRYGAIVFCSYHSVSEVCLAIEEVGGDRVSLLTWFKRNAPPAIANVPRFTTEFAWAFKKAPGIEWRRIRNTMIDIPMAVAGTMAVERFIDEHKRAVHPTQKPVELMLALVDVGIESVLDPFCGTGTTLVAAKQLGVRAIGIEINERWAELSAKRLEQGVLDFAAAGDMPLIGDRMEAKPC